MLNNNISSDNLVKLIESTNRNLMLFLERTEKIVQMTDMLGSFRKAIITSLGGEIPDPNQYDDPPI